MKCAWPYCEEQTTKDKVITYKSTDGEIHNTKPLCKDHYDDNVKYLKEKGRFIK